MFIFIRNKLIWGGLGIIILAASIFTFAFMGSTVNPTPKQLPLAVVSEDLGVVLPNGKKVNLSQTLVEGLQKRDTSSVKWRMMNGKDEALAAMNEKEIYAAILLPEDLSQNIFSLLSNSPTKPTATIILNEGMNFSGATLANQISSGVLSNFNEQIQQQLLNQITQTNTTISVDTVELISNPVTIDVEEINTVGTNNANGNTPALFTQVLWIGTFISSMILFTVIRKSTEGHWTFSSFASQTFAGILYLLIFSGVTLFLAVRVLDISVPSTDQLYMMMVYIGLCFFFLQNALLNWIGYPAAPLFILLLFFSMPIMTMAPEMLPDITRDYLYSWVPFRFSLENLRDILFFKKDIFKEGIDTLGVIGLISFILMGLSVFKADPKQAEKVKNKKYHETNV
jgi:YhgE/Pip-like protein